MVGNKRWVVLLLVACERTVPAIPPTAPSPAPAPAVHAPAPTVPDDVEPTAATDVEPRCDPAEKTAAGFRCLAPGVCPAQDTADATVDMTEFLCVARDAAAPDRGPLQIGDVLARMPARFLHNFTLKHGTEEDGLRGHPREIIAEVVHRELAMHSQSADLDFPRLMIWDESTGFTLSYNGGLSLQSGGTREQTGFDRLDLMRWDDQARAFELWALDIPIERDASGWQLRPYQPVDTDDNCTHCHGPDSRPVWPMYPDWPGFYGSDNDELTQPTPHQRTELSFLQYFRHCVAPGQVRRDDRCRSAQDAALSGHQPEPKTEAEKVRVLEQNFIDTRRRYDVFFADKRAEHLDEVFRSFDVDIVRAYLTGLGALRPDLLRRVRSPEALTAVNGTQADLRAWLGLSLHDAYPYRPNAREQSSEPSRAFFHRPNLRLGVLYNRLLARQLHAKIRTHDNYRGFEKLFAFALMDCGWPASAGKRPAALAAFEAQAGDALASTGKRLTPAEHPTRILYPALLAAVGLTVADVDMRYSYPNKRYNPFAGNYGAANVVTNVMALGYLEYGADDHNRLNDSPYYFNSYWDGSATINELLVARVLEDIAADAPEYRALYTLQSLTAKYERFKSRQPLDEVFFHDMDAMGRWFPTPYPKRLDPLHHRQSLSNKRFRAQYRAVCKQLSTDLVETHAP